ncbi:MAG: LacI family DNA-binding transcriptional regulator [Rhodothermales bacterium]|nr:LacI family DNA-binding transcriptional regulator [Rhodothermales bacterium]
MPLDNNAASAYTLCRHVSAYTIFPPTPAALGITIYDIAEKAGVSIATVSRVFNDSPRVSDKTRDRVMNVAAELGYQPHASARSLARRRTEIVSAVIPMITNYFFTEVLRGVQDRMAETDFDLLVFSARTLDEVEIQLDRALHRGRSAGVLLFSTPLMNGMVERLTESGQPVVLVDSFHPAFDSISTDNRRGGEMAGEHLIEIGCTSPAMIMASPDSRPAADRKEGFLSILREAGIPADDNYVVSSSEGLNHGYSEKSGYEAAKKLLATGLRPDGIFVTSDIQALGVMEALREMDYEIPADVRIVGFDDIVVSKYIGLTTLRQPMYEMGSTAVRKLMDRLTTPDRPVSHTVFSPHLVTRLTSGGAVANGSAITVRTPG